MEQLPEGLKYLHAHIITYNDNFQFPPGLVKLKVSGIKKPPSSTPLPALPPTLQVLDISKMSTAIDFNKLPPSLKTLRLPDTTFISKIPPGVTSLRYSEHIEPMWLPTQLTELDVQHYIPNLASLVALTRLTTIVDTMVEEFPPNLKHLTLRTRYPCQDPLPPLPHPLISFNYQGTAPMLAFNEHLQSLTYNNRTHQIIHLPPNLVYLELFCANTTLPILPPTLKVLMTGLPTQFVFRSPLPTSLTLLYLCGDVGNDSENGLVVNPLTHTYLPPHLKHMSCPRVWFEKWKKSLPLPEMCLVFH